MNKQCGGDVYNNIRQESTLVNDMKIKAELMRLFWVVYNCESRLQSRG